jgi:hypothetical protein
MIPWSSLNSSKPWSCCACRDPKTTSKVGDYLRADGPLEGKNDNFDPVLNSKERYGVQLNVGKVFMLTARLQLEIMATDPPPKSPGTYPIPPVFFM